MNDYVQFARNLLCCVKDWQVGPAWLHDPNVTALYYDFPEPLNKTTPLEFWISWLQLYPFIFLTQAGYTMVTQGIGIVYRVEAFVKDRPKKVSSSAIEKNEEIAQRLVTAKLVKDGKQAIKDIIVGVQLLFIGLAFFWLFANSWHVTETDWIGGIWGLIHALTVMEVCLLVLLYYMVTDGLDKLKQSKAKYDLADSIKYKKFKEKAVVPPMNLVTYEYMSEWDPFWNIKAGTGKDVKEETARVRRQLEIYRGSGKDDGGEKEEKIRQKALEGIAERLKEEAFTTKMEGYREFVFFALNFVAFYGYLMGILCFYFEEHGNEAAWMKALKFNYSHDLADWHGNFAGDLMWTIEPIVVLSSPMYFNFMKPKSTKRKTD